MGDVMSLLRGDYSVQGVFRDTDFFLRPPGESNYLPTKFPPSPSFSPQFLSHIYSSL